MYIKNRCVICGSDDPINAFGTIINENAIVVCRICANHIRGITDDSVRDCQYDDFFAKIEGVRSIVINRTAEGFSLSFDAQMQYVTTLNLPYVLKDRSSRDLTQRYGPQIIANGRDDWYFRIPRDDNLLVDIVRKLGDKAAGPMADLRIVRIPANVDWTIEQHYGAEWIVEKHRHWC